MNKLSNQLRQTKKDAEQFALSTDKQRVIVLQKIATALLRNEKKILAANKKDILRYKGDNVMIERLSLNSKKIKEMAEGTLAVARLKDPLGVTLEKKKLKNGLILTKISVPLGVVGVIYESRPNVTLDLSVLALRTGNGVVLKGGKESYFTNKAIVAVVQNVLAANRISKNIVMLIDPAMDWKKDLLQARNLVDVLIPRGGASLINFVRENARIPVIETGAGVCHTFVDVGYNIEKAADIVVGSKIQRPSACNALDTLVIHKKILAPFFAASAIEDLVQAGVQIFADAPSFAVLRTLYPKQLLRKARASDYGKEFLAMKMSVKTVANFEDGLAFVKAHTSWHSEAILTDHKEHAKRFLTEVDAAVVYQNASTRFTDGAEFGMGAEVGISTQKLHARGPMGVESLTSYKWIAIGRGTMRK